MNKYLMCLLVIMGLTLSSCQKNVATVNPSDLYGTWGGQGLVMMVGPDGATLEYDCARGTIDEPILPDAEGTFEVSGTTIPSMPVGMPDPPQENVMDSKFSGIIDGNTMVVTVTLEVSGNVLGPFTLIFGEPGTLFKCL